MSFRSILDHLMPRIGPVIVSFLVLLGFIVSISCRRIINRIRADRAANWPTINGSVTTTNVRAIRAERAELAFAELGYSYEVAGSYYSGYFKLQFPDEQAAWTFVDKLKGQLAVIRYNPRNPEISTLRTQDQGPGFQSESVLTSLLPRAL